MTHVLVARLDNDGDVLLTGPAVRAIRQTADRVTFLCSPRGKAAAELLPGIDEIVVFDAPWVAFDAKPVDQAEMLRLVGVMAALAPDEAVIFTSFHQSPLPLALLLRMAWVPKVAATSVDYPGSLLDVRHLVSDDLHEVQRNLSLVESCGYRLPAHDDGALRVRLPETVQTPPLPDEPYVVVHPGASVPARAWAPERNAETVRALAEAGWHVVVTGSNQERALTARVAGPPHPRIHNLGGRTDLAGLATVLERAHALVVGNTGPAHLAAAVGTAVVEVFAPTVPAIRWHPWRVPQFVLGQQDIGCSGCRARVCPVEGQPCIGGVHPEDVVRAVRELVGDPADEPEEAAV
jgi:ADP-heptose:LPS heptosyltransferase